ncbi:hypothetical protein B296_00016438 [Ensete ventricosum]|uniref:Uncharacterized protein n=1 Tax=Ensete ventricosum TaxID=4639 RepID=A0A427A3Z7_ENSVE|nr:hypothetical protein B296_00016438 [Ensete ventricosum]
MGEGGATSGRAPAEFCWSREVCWLEVEGGESRHHRKQAREGAGMTEWVAAKFCQSYEFGNAEEGTSVDREVEGEGSMHGR